MAATFVSYLVEGDKWIISPRGNIRDQNVKCANLISSMVNMFGFICSLGFHTYIHIVNGFQAESTMSR